MRVLIVSGAPLDGDPLGPGALAAALEGVGAEPRLVAPAGAGPVRTDTPKRRLPGRAGLEATLSALAVSVSRSFRPHAALVMASPGARGAPLALAAARVPVVLLASLEGLGPGFRAGARAARALVTLEPALPARLAEDLGIRGVIVLGGGSLDLEALPTGSREAARRAIGLEPAQRFLALTGPLDPPVRVDLLALAHRRLAGIGLLVIGTGEEDARVAAMSAATRPSSPVLHIPTLDLEARRIAVQAADVALALHPTRLGEDALLAAALGRVIVALDHEELARIDALYPGLDAVIRASAPTSAALERALRAGLERAERPFPGVAVEAARSALGRGRPVDQLFEVLSRCASSS